MGIIVNRPAGSIDFPGLLVQLDIIQKADQIKLPENAETMPGHGKLGAAAGCAIGITRRTSPIRGGWSRLVRRREAASGKNLVAHDDLPD